jgi:hypothetical protein
MTKRTLKYLILAVLLGGVLMAATASARSPRWRPPPRQSAFTVSLQAGHGGRLQTFQHRGQTWVLGEPGERYAIRLTNPTDRRVEAVISVDGRDAVSGEVADFVRQRGYVIPPFGSVTVEGFRTSLDSVATFRFTDPSNSFSSRMGTPQNVGVIGVAFFNERAREQIARRDNKWRSRSSKDAPSAASPPKPKKSAPGRAGASESARDEASNIGTEFGEGRSSSVTEVSFQRETPSRPTQTVTVRYDDVQGLQARGIDVFPDRIRRATFDGEPEAFPRSRFTQPPR